MQRQNWEKSHEAKVDKFYGQGVEKYGEHHGGYLNFGLWEEGITNYISAAENLVKKMGGMLNLSSQSKLLDVGCGMGAQDILLHQQFGCRITAIDVTWNHVLSTHQRIQSNNFSNFITVHHGTATNLPFSDRQFSGLLSIEAPEHFNTRERFFREALRVLKPGGKMVLADYVLKRSPKNRWERGIVNIAAKWWHVPKENYETADSYKRKLEKNSFTNVQIDEVGAQTIPGYYFEQKKKECRTAVRKIRGWFAAYPGFLIDVAVYQAFQKGLIEYVLVRAEKA